MMRSASQADRVLTASARLSSNQIISLTAQHPPESLLLSPVLSQHQPPKLPPRPLEPRPEIPRAQPRRNNKLTPEIPNPSSITSPERKQFINLLGVALVESPYDSHHQKTPGSEPVLRPT